MAGTEGERSHHIVFGSDPEIQAQLVGSRRGGSRKLQRMAMKKVDEDKSHQKFMDELPEFQFDRAFKRICEGVGSNEDKLYVAEKRALQGDFFAATVFRRLADVESMVIERPEFSRGVSHPNDEIPLSSEEQILGELSQSAQ